MSKPLQQRVEHILDTVPGEKLDVIVQMEADRAITARLARAAGRAVRHRRLALTPRDLLPQPYGKPAVKPRKMEETASDRARLDQARAATFALKRIQESGWHSTDALMNNPMVQGALDRMLTPTRKSSLPKGEGPNRFWTSRAMPLRLTRWELARLPDKVAGIEDIHLNRRLSVPALLQTRRPEVEEKEVFHSTWGLERCNALAAWGLFGNRGRGVTIGLLDTGVDAEHPDLKGKIAHWAEFDYAGNQADKSQPHDSHTHGTHCAGTLVGGDGSGRCIGLAPEAKIAAALVLNGEQGGTDAQVLAGIDWAVDQGVDVISLSLGGLMMDPETPSTYTQAILSCVEAGIPVVVAIGNEGEQTTGSPGNDLFALSVGATDPQDRVAAFSGGRTQIIYESDYIDPADLPLIYSKPELTAPGVAVYSSVPGGSYQSFSGTSMATPHVAAAIALLLSTTSIRDKKAGLERVSTIQDLIIGSVTDLGESGPDHRYGFGRLDVLRAIGFAKKLGY
ncbi:S8 family peptidase [Candidatus Thiosymbion oneisti]|uniref:S8 family peptidase n=1 Tax=Candidatus Thiosymbion oneisti TaxID=589554 RepID=UPI0013FD29BA|nr:S8 family serine peptidase [Candidatus Thiosymbion oneisti]